MRAPIQVKILEVFKIPKRIWQHMQIMATSQVKMLEVCEIPESVWQQLHACAHSQMFQGSEIKEFFRQ
jgi:hypothetical protein